MPQTLTFKGEVITLPEMPDEFSWDVDSEYVHIFQRSTSALANPHGQEVLGYICLYTVPFITHLSRLGAHGTAVILKTTNLQEAIDLLATRVMLGGADYSELP